MGTFKRETLEAKTVVELRDILRKKQIKGMMKKPKRQIINAIMDSQKGAVPAAAVAKPSKASPKSTGPVTKMSLTMDSELTKPGARFGNRTKTTVRVSCGASSGDFPVCGKSVGAVANFLREVLNVDKLAEGLVNGEKVSEDYVLREGDTLEYIKPAGRKG